MLKRFKQQLLVVMSLLALTAPAVLPAAAYAAGTVSDGVCKGVGIATQSSTACTSTPGGVEGALGGIARQIVNVFSILIGIIAVIFIIYGGFRYITSGGESGRVAGAKNTLIYALLGLVIVALAQFLVRIVLSTAAGIPG